MPRSTRGSVVPNINDINETEIRTALSVAKDARRKYSCLRQENLSQRAQIQANQRNRSERLLSSTLTGTGHDIMELEKICEQTQVEMGQFLEKQKSAVIKRSSSVKDTLRYRTDARRKVIEGLALAPIFNSVVLDTPLFILPSQGINLAPPHIQPWNNVAKISGQWETPYPDNRSDNVSFVFVWKNPSAKYAVVNVLSSLILNGFCYAWADAGVFVSNLASLIISGRLGILEWWNNPPTSPPEESGQIQDIVDLEAQAYGHIFEVGDYESSAISGYYGFDYQQFVLPPEGVAVFEVELDIFHAIETFGGHGSIGVDFASGDFEVMCPAVIIFILS
jgi:hypothetical protein